MAPKKPAKKKPAARKRSAQKTQVQTDRGSRQVKDDQSEANGEAKAPPAEGLSDYRPNHTPLENSGLDQHAAHEERRAELQRERDEHNERTGDASLR